MENVNGYAKEAAIGAENALALFRTCPLGVSLFYEMGLQLLASELDSTGFKTTYRYLRGRGIPHPRMVRWLSSNEIDCEVSLMAAVFSPLRGKLEAVLNGKPHCNE
jgi:hypothetical protein